MAFVKVDRPKSPKAGLFDFGTFDNARFDESEGFPKEDKPATSFTKEDKPATSFVKQNKP